MTEKEIKKIKEVAERIGYGEIKIECVVSRSKIVKMIIKDTSEIVLLK